MMSPIIVVLSGKPSMLLLKAEFLRRTVDLTPDERYQILGEIEAEMKASNEGNAERCWEPSVVS